MPGGNKNIRPEDNTNGFQKNPQNINRKGRPYSIDKKIKELLSKEGEYIIKADDIIEVLENGDLRVKITTSEQITLQLLKFAKSKKGHEALKAINMIMERMDGKPIQKNINADLTIEDLKNINPFTFYKNE